MLGTASDLALALIGLAAALWASIEYLRYWRRR
jgi:hypothetical protein